MGCYRKDGTFDSNAVIVSVDQKAIDWGLEVYDEYEKLSGDSISLENIIYPDKEE